MKLHCDFSGPENGPPVLLAHGLFGQGRNLGVVARHLARLGARVGLVDMRNHGDSPDDPRHDYLALGEDLAQTAAGMGDRVDVIGHSMGGKAAMAMALGFPEQIGRLVVLDIAPLAYSHSQTSYIEAMEALDLSKLKSRSEADRRLAAQVPDRGVRAFLLQNLELRANPPSWKLNLRALRDQMDHIIGWPQELAQSAHSGAALFLAGQNSDYVDSRGTAAIQQHFPKASVEHIANAGHWLHAEQPEEVNAHIADFLELNA